MDGSMMALGVEPLMPSLIGRTGMVEGSVPQGAEKVIGRGDLRTGQSSLGVWRPSHSGDSKISMEPLKSSKAERGTVLSL